MGVGEVDDGLWTLGMGFAALIWNFQPPSVVIVTGFPNL